MSETNHAFLRQPIYIIESPGSFDLYTATNEGDALARTLSLANVKVVYYLAVDCDHVKEAFKSIALDVLSQDDGGSCKPFIHISAHGSDEGIELTDGDCFFWEMLNQQLSRLDDELGAVFKQKGAPRIPRSALAFSSCSAYANYADFERVRPLFSQLVGPTSEVGWCQALVAYSTFYYRSLVAGDTFPKAVEAMNAAAVGVGGDPIFSWSIGFDVEAFKLFANANRRNRESEK